MKFEPNKPSFIIALNLDTVKEDLEVIKEFYSGEVTALVGHWRGRHEASYQLNSNETDYQDMVDTLYCFNQEAFLIINTFQLKGVWLHNFKHMKHDCHPNFLGHMTQIPDKEDCCTYCPTSNTYWRAKWA